MNIIHRQLDLRPFEVTKNIREYQNYYIMLSRFDYTEPTLKLLMWKTVNVYN